MLTIRAEQIDEFERARLATMQAPIAAKMAIIFPNTFDALTTAAPDSALEQARHPVGTAIEVGRGLGLDNCADLAAFVALGLGLDAVKLAMPDWIQAWLQRTDMAGALRLAVIEHRMAQLGASDLLLHTVAEHVADARRAFTPPTWSGASASASTSVVLPCESSIDTGTLIVLAHHGDSGAPIPNLAVRVNGPTPGNRRTDALGSVTLEGRSPGEYVAAIFPPVLAGLTLLPGPLNGMVAAGGIAIIDIAAASYAELTVEVSDDYLKLITGDVKIRIAGAQTQVQAAPTGVHVFAGIAVGEYTVSAEVPEGRYRPNTDQHRVTVIPGGTMVALTMPRYPVNISSIAFLDDEMEVHGTVKQYVNLRRDPKYIDHRNVTSIDRLGRHPRIKVRFKQPGKHKFYVEMKPSANNVVYSGAEKARHPSFDLSSRNIRRNYITNETGTLILPLEDFVVSLAGKDQFTLVAVDELGNVVQSGVLEVYRLLYYVVMRMPSARPIATLTTLESEYRKYNIELVKLAETEIRDMAVVDKHDDVSYMQFQSHVREGMQACPVFDELGPVLTIVYVPHLAQKVRTTICKPVNAAGGLIDVDTDKELWYFNEQRWWVSAVFESSDASVEAASIRKEACTAVSLVGNYYNRVRIDTKPFRGKNGTIHLTLNVVGKRTGGANAPNTNVIYLATKNETGDVISSEQQLSILMHELGHKIGMVATGKGSSPDAPANWYDQERVPTHIGNHCHSGFAKGFEKVERNLTDSANALCVMYGLSSELIAFCPQCKPVLAKLDMSAPWVSF